MYTVALVATWINNSYFSQILYFCKG